MIAAIDPAMRLAVEQGTPASLGILSTLLFVVAYLGWFGWAYLPSNRAVMEELGRIPFEDDLPGGDS